MVKWMENFECKDIGMTCGFKTSAKTHEELMDKIADHARKVHHINSINDELRTKIENAITTED